jgi:hypothetical protein
VTADYLTPLEREYVAHHALRAGVKVLRLLDEKMSQLACALARVADLEAELEHTGPGGFTGPLKADTRTWHEMAVDAAKAKSPDFALAAANARVAELEADRAAELEARGRYGFANAESLSTVTELLRAASLALPAPWPLPREIGLAIQAVLSAAPAPTKRECVGCTEGFEADHPCSRTCKGCLAGTEDHHTCARAVLPPQTWVPPSGRQKGNS